MKVTLFSPSFISLKARLKVSDKKELAIQGILLSAAFFAIVIVFLIIFYLIRGAYPLYQHVNLLDFLFGLVWQPNQQIYGAAPIILGTVYVTIGAMIISLPLGLGCAIFIAFIAPKKVRVFIKSAVELLAGVPSVVFGFFGIQVILPWVRNTFDTPGPSLFAASLLVGLISLPVVVSVMEDALTSVSRDMWEASMGIGATKWETISKVIIQSSISGLGAAVLLGVGRSMGETMAVLMVAGNSNTIPLTFFDLFKPISTITGTIGMEMGEAFGLTHMIALFGLAVILMLIVLVINSISNLTISRLRKRMQGELKHTGRVPKKEARIIRWIFLIVVSVVILDFISVIAGIIIAIVVAAIVTGIWILIKVLPRVLLQGIAFSIISIAAATVVFFLGYIIYDIVSKGAPVATVQFIFSMPSGNGKSGGIFSAIIGTLELVAGALIIAVPIGICAAIYLNEYSRENILKKIIRIGVDNLNGMPSIIFGLFGYTLLVIQFGFGYSLIAGQFTLGFMILPTIIRTTEESLKTVPQSLREASLALGATKWQTITKIVLPTSAPGTLTGIILSIGRAAGETAPILFTACALSRFLPRSLLDPVMALPYQIYMLSTVYPGAISQAYGTAYVLLVLVLLMYGIAIVLRMYYRSKFKL